MGSPWRFRGILVAAVLVAAELVTLVVVPDSQASLFFLFNRASARPGMTVLAFQDPAYVPSPKGIVVYLIPTRLPGVSPNAAGGYILFHPPTHDVVKLGNARRLPGSTIGIRFRVPRVRPGNYTIGLWCSACYKGHGDFFPSAPWGEKWTGAPGDVLRVTR